MFLAALTYHQLAATWFYLVFAMFWLPPVLLAMRFATPKRIVERYFKQPHFNFGETIIYSHFPGSLIRTLVFISACYSNRHRQGRQLDGYLDLAPRWYVTASRVFVGLLFGHAAVAVFVTIWILLHPGS